MSKISPGGRKRLVECTCLISLAFLLPSLFKIFLAAPPSLIAAAHCSHMTIDSEPEWLYNDPPFFRGFKEDVVHAASDADVDPGFRLLTGPLKNCLRTFQRRDFGDEIRALAIDVPRNTKLKATPSKEIPWESLSLHNTSALDGYLRRERTRDFAKKRLMYVAFP